MNTAHVPQQLVDIAQQHRLEVVRTTELDNDFHPLFALIGFENEAQLQSVAENAKDFTRCRLVQPSGSTDFHVTDYIGEAVTITEAMYEGDECVRFYSEPSYFEDLLTDTNYMESEHIDPSCIRKIIARIQGLKSGEVAVVRGNDEFFEILQTQTLDYRDADGDRSAVGLLFGKQRLAFSPHQPTQKTNDLK